MVRPGLVAGAVLLLAAPAMAQTYDHAEPTGDTTAASYDPYTGAGATVPSPQNTHGDLGRVEVDYRANSWTVVVHLADPATIEGDLLDLSLAAVSGRWTYAFEVWVNRYQGEVRTGAEYAAFRGHRLRPALRCRRLGVAFDEQAATVTVHAPARCLGSARTVRVAMLSMFTNVDDETGSTWYDDAFTPTPVDPERDRIGLSPPIRRGGADTRLSIPARNDVAGPWLSTLLSGRADDLSGSRPRCPAAADRRPVAPGC